MLKTGLFTALILGLVPATVAADVINADPPGSAVTNFQQDHSLVGKSGSHDIKIVNLDRSANYVLEVKTMDEPDLMTWDAAINAVKKHGSGWRLPTIVELKMIYEQRKSIGGFSGEDYWSSKEQDVNSAWIQGFRLGDQDRYNKQSKLKVRAVRSF
jgi:Protein of unknown function (DUF1566)